MEKSEARRKLKGLQLIVHNRKDAEVLDVFDAAQAWIDSERPASATEPVVETESKPRKERTSRDRQERGGRDRGSK